MAVGSQSCSHVNLGLEQINKSEPHFLHLSSGGELLPSFPYSEELRMIMSCINKVF